MKQPGPTCPMSRADVIDTYFMEHRAKLIDIAAFLDRVERAIEDAASDDVRVAALRQAAGILIDGDGDRAQRILDLFSDHTTEPIERAHTKGAIGVDPNGPYGQGA